MEYLYNLLNRLFLETFCFIGIVACVAGGALLYEPPVPPPEQCNYSEAWTAPVGRDFSEPWILEDK